METMNLQRSHLSGVRILNIFILHEECQKIRFFYFGSPMSGMGGGTPEGEESWIQKLVLLLHR